MAGDVKIGISVDASDANAGLKSISKNLDQVAESVQGATNEMREGLDDAATAADKVAKKLPKAGAGAKKASAGLKGAASSAKGLGDQLGSVETQAGKSASVMSGLAGALSIVSPEAGAAAASLSAASGGIEAVARSGMALAGPLAALTAGVAIGVKIWDHYAEKQREVQRELEETRRKKIELTAAMTKLDMKTLAAKHEAMLAEGKITQAELSEYKIRNAAETENAAVIDEANKEKNAARHGLIKSIKAQAVAQNLLNQHRDKSTHLAQKQRERLQAATKATEQARLRDTEAARAAITLRSAITAKTNAHVKFISKSLEAAKAEKSTGGGGSRAKARRAEEDRARMAQLKAQLAAIKSLQKAERSAQVASLEGEAKILAVSADRVDSLNAIAAEHTANAQVSAALESATAELTKNRDAEIAELRAKNLADLTEARAKRESDAQKQHEDELTRIAAEASARRQAMAELTGNTSALFAALSDNVSGMDREMATKLFNVSKGFTVAQIGFSTAEGLMTAAALPPPVDAIKAAAVIAQAGASLAMVSAQKPAFHTGTGMVQSPGQRRELNARLRAGEAVSTPLGSEIIGRDNIERANAGISGGGGSAPVVFQYEHRVFSRFIRDNARMRGPLSSEINRGKNSGHRG